MPGSRSVAAAGFRLLVPCGLPLAFLPLLLRAAADGGPWRGFLGLYPWLALGLAAAMSIRLDRARIAAVAAVVVLAERALAASGGNPATVLGVAAFVALDLVALAWLREPGLVSDGSFLWLVALMAEVGVVLWLGMPEHAVFAGHLTAELASLRLPIPLPQSAALLIALAGVTLSSRFFARRAAFDAGLLWALVAVSGGIAARADGVEVVRAYVATALVAIVVAAFEQSLAHAYQDELTGLPGRRALQESLDRLGGDFAIAMIDIDHFKRLNDRYGHDVGDQVLRMVASRLREGGAKLFRYGGEEFAAVLRGADMAVAGQEIEAMRKRVAGAKFVVRSPGRPQTAPEEKSAVSADHVEIKVTISAGVAAGAPGESPAEVMARADRALYKAKENGRNRVEV